MVVALSRATTDGHMLFGANLHRPAGEGQGLVCLAGRPHAVGETLQTTHLSLPQVRQTCSVLGARRFGQWGLLQGLNEHGVVAGVTSIRTRLAATDPALTGPDLVRLALERASSARQAIDVLTDLVCRHGQGDPDTKCDSAFLVADGREAFVVETAGSFWAEQVVGSVRAVGSLCQLRQDWDRISRGLADRAIEQGWWEGDGSKLDFAGALGVPHDDASAALRRWGRATMLLEQQSGLIDAPYFRRVLADHGNVLLDKLGPNTPRQQTSLCRHAGDSDAPGTAVSTIAEVRLAGSLPVLWCCFGQPCTGLYFPLFLVGELPDAFLAEGPDGSCLSWAMTLRLAAVVNRTPDRAAALREGMQSLQEQFDQHAREFLAEASGLQQRGEQASLHRLAGSLMQHHLEQWEDLCEEICPTEWRAFRGPHGTPFAYVSAGD
jgi:secernin